MLSGWSRKLGSLIGAAALALPLSAQIRSGYDPNTPAAPATEAMTRGLDTDQKIGAFLPFELRFTSAEGKQIRLAELFDLAEGSAKSGGKHRPVLVALVYYDCPVVCSATMDKISGMMRRLGYEIGEDFKVAFFSFDASESPARAREVKEHYLAQHPRGLIDGPSGRSVFNPTIAEHWNFFVGEAGANRELANALGFKYRAAANGEFAHSSVFMILTPEGRISRYLSPFLGDEQKLADQTKLALLEASDGKIAKSASELIMAWCFMYDPKAGAYTLQAIQVMKIGGVLSIFAVGGLVVGMLLWEKLKRKPLDKLNPSAPATA